MSEHDDALKAEIKSLQQRLAEMRQERAVLQRRIASRSGLPSAIERAKRQRSTSSSPQIDQLRRKIEDTAHEIVEIWRKQDDIRALYTRAMTTGLLSPDASYEEHSERERAQREEIAKEFQRRDVRIVVPPTPSLGAAGITARTREGSFEREGV